MGEVSSDRVIIDRNVGCRMRDGTVLRSDVYRPDVGSPLPVLLTRLPYDKGAAGIRDYVDPVRAAAGGYIVVVQDVRGRFSSGGTWFPFVNEFDDGADTVAWASALAGSDGRVAMFGLSYYGETQWQAAVGRPPALAAMAPAVTWGRYLNGVNRRGGAREFGSMLNWYLRVVGPDLWMRQRLAPGAPRDGRLSDLLDAIDRIDETYATLPLASIPDSVGVLAEMFDLLSRPVDDPFWTRISLEDRYAAVDVPTLHIAGWYDIFLQETLRQYEAMERLASARGGRPPRLVIGPWTHGAFGSFQGDLEFGIRSAGRSLQGRRDLTGLHLDFFDDVLKGRSDPSPSVSVFLMGENRWIDLDRWPPRDGRPERWYLHSEGAARTAAGDGTLSSEPPQEEPPDTYLYDPANPVPAIGGALLMPDRYIPGPRDQSPNERRPDVLCYTSEPFNEPCTLLGAVSVTLWAASSAPSTDFVARLVDVHPDGRAITLTDGIVRTLWRESYPEPGRIVPRPPSPITPGQPYAFALDLWSTGVTFLPGHRMRLEITSSSFPRWDRNLNTGDDDASKGASRTAHQTVFHDAGRPSVLVVTRRPG